MREEDARDREERTAERAAWAIGRVTDRLEDDIERWRRRALAAEERLECNRCNSGHETLPLKLWDCPECARQRTLLWQAIARAADNLQKDAIDGFYTVAYETADSALTVALDVARAAGLTWEEERRLPTG